MRALMDARPRPDAVFCANDLMASGALRALSESGRRVPDDVAVIGFDDAPLARHTTPPLTTMRQPIDEMTRAMIDLLCTQISRGTGRGQRVICATTLVRRASA